MGLFGSKRKTHVGTTVSRVIEDKLIPDSSKTGAIKAVFNDGDIPQYINEELINSIGLRAERMYAYAKRAYTYGLPSGENISAMRGRTEIEAVLSAIESTAILIDYSRLGPPNSLHIAWMQLFKSYGYNPLSNELGTLTAQRGTPVYLHDLEVVIPGSQIDLLAPAAVEQWGLPARTGFTPERAANLITRIVSHSPVRVDPTAGEEYVLATVVWKTAAPPGYTVNGELWYGEVMNSETFRLAIDGSDELTTVNPEKDYFHVKYKVGNTVKYWMYEIGKGTYPTIDAVLTQPIDIVGSFFPFTYFRYNKQDDLIDTSTPAFKTSRRLLKYLGLDYETTAAAINANPDIDDVEQAMLVMAVPALSTDPIETRYLYTFFDQWFADSASQFSSSIIADIQGQLADEPDLTKATKIIEDKRFKMALSHGGIFKSRKPGVLGAIGSHHTEYRVDTETVLYHDTMFEASGEEAGTGAGQIGVPGAGTETSVVREKIFEIGRHYYRKQLTETIYEEIQVTDLRMLYHVFEAYTVTGDDDDPILLIPLDRSITEKYSISEREHLYGRSLHFVFNSRVVTKIKWYQTPLFGYLIIIVAIAVVVWTYNVELGLLIEAIAAGSAAGIGLAAWALITKIIQGYLVSFAFKLFVAEVGVEAAFVIAILLVAYLGYEYLASEGVSGGPWAKELIFLSSGLNQGVQTVTKTGIEDLKDEYSDFDKYVTEQTKLLTSTQELLDSPNTLSPFVIFGETPNDFYNRSIHSGNIGAIGISAISAFVDTALTLPKLSDLSFNENEANEGIS